MYHFANNSTFIIGDAQNIGLTFLLLYNSRVKRVILKINIY